MYSLSNNNNNLHNLNVSNISSKPYSDFERLYYEKCGELENFEINFDKISEKFTLVINKIHDYQLNLIEDNKRLKEFLMFILQCFNHKQYEYITFIINYVRDNQTFINKQIFENPEKFPDSYKKIESKFFEKSHNLINENVNEKKFISNFSFSSNEEDKFKPEKDINYSNLKFSKSIISKIDSDKKGISINNNNNDINDSQFNSNFIINFQNLTNVKNINPLSDRKIYTQKEKSKDITYVFFFILI
jgi:hypothetical protein